MKNLLILPLLALLHPLPAQTTLEVITKTIEKEMAWESGYEVNIEGDRAEIIIQTWTSPEVRVVLELVSKHPDRAIAERDLKAMQHSIKQEGKMIYFRNYISPAGGQPQPESQLKAIYTVHVPETCPVYLKNNFGNTSVSNLRTKLRLNSEFSKVFLQDLSGSVFVQTRFGDITGERISGTVQIESRRSDITLRDISGTFDINSSYGIIKLFTDQSQLRMNIVAERSDVFVFDPKPSAYGYTLTAHYGSITVPSDLKMNFLENNQTIQRAVFSPGKEMASISVKITFGDIVIRNP